MDQSRPTPKTLRLLERFRVQRTQADAALDELDATAHALARALAADGLTLRDSAPWLSRDRQPLSHAAVAKVLAGSASRKPLVGNRRQGGKRD